MMKILLILPRFDRKRWDSLTDQAWNIAKLLTAGGMAQCSIVAARREDEKSMEVVCNVPINRFAPQLPRWRFLRRFHNRDVDFRDAELPGLELFLRKKQFDLVHIMCSGRLCEKAAEILYERKIPYIISCRSEDFRPKDAACARFDESRGLFRKMFREYGEALARAERVFCSDHALRRLLAVHLGDRPLIHWLPGVELERFSCPSPVDFRQFYQIPASRKIILSVGRICASKNQKMLLETLEILKRRHQNCHLVVIGWSESDDFLTEFSALAKERRMDKLLTVIPGLPPGDECFRAAFQAASLVMLPSRFEVSASAILEAWSAGVPVIASPVGGGELIEDSVNGKVANPHDFQSFVRGCEELLDEKNRSSLEKMRSNGMMTARSLRWERRMEDLISIYNEVLQINQHNNNCG